MWKLCITACLCFLYLVGFTNNVRILGDVRYDPDDVRNGNKILKLSFTLAWDNSWRDDYNWDAVYLCLKYKVVTPPDASKEWQHAYLCDDGHKVTADFDYTLAQNYSQDYKGGKVANTGIFIYRKFNNGGPANVEVELAFDITSNTREVLTEAQIKGSMVQFAAVGIEMVYVPTSVYKLGDSYSRKTFRKAYTPIPSEYDLVDTNYAIVADSGDPLLAADRINDNEASASSAWKPSKGTSAWWRIDFGENEKDWKTIRYFGVNAAKGSPKPAVWALFGSNEKNINTSLPALWEGGPNDWVIAADAYPIEHAIRVPDPKPYRYYHIYIKSMTGIPVVKSIGMTDRELGDILDQCVTIEGPEIKLDSLKYLGARDGEQWTGSATFPHYPNGFLGFYAMKYEVSQEQYVKFLNKLTRAQQEALIPAIRSLNEGDYIFGDRSRPTARNGITISKKEAGSPYIFANDMNKEDEISKAADGQTLACNFMSINDMLAYADWVGLRPLSEMEFEKISRRPFPTVPLKGEYAWNDLTISSPTELTDAATANETPVGGNANYGRAQGIGGPLRVGAFAKGQAGQTASGVSFYGAMDVSGNLAEIYYNANTKGRDFKAFTNYSHGDGYLKSTGLTDNGLLTNVASSYWPQDAALAFAVRGGSYLDDESYLSISDRNRNMNYFKNVYTRDSSVSFRLGHSVPQAAEDNLDVWLTLHNGRTSKESNASDTICGYLTTYTIKGNKPENIQGSYTFLWYMLEDGGEWHVLEGENDCNLTYTGFVNNLPRLKKYQFKRMLITPVAYAMTAPVTVVVDQAMSVRINIHTDTIDGYQRTKDGFYVSSTIQSEFKWYWIYRGRALQLHPYSSSDYYSHYVPSIDDFKLADGTPSYGENVVHMERTTKGVNSCVTMEEVKVVIKKEKPVTVRSNEIRICGTDIQDIRDNKVYRTVAIGRQCWMADNLDLWTHPQRGSIGRCYGGKKANCDRYGRMYTWEQANLGNYSNTTKTGICPAGWHLPTNVEWNNLIANLQPEQAKKLKATKFWQYVNDNLIPSNEAGFNALPGGYYMSGDGGMNYYARWWTSYVTQFSYSYIAYTQRVHQYYCPNHAPYWKDYPVPSYCGPSRTRWINRDVWATGYYYSGNYVELYYNSNGMSQPTYLRNDRNSMSNDYLYVRCVKD